MDQKKFRQELSGFATHFWNAQIMIANPFDYLNADRKFDAKLLVEDFMETHGKVEENDEKYRVLCEVANNYLSENRLVFPRGYDFVEVEIQN